MFNLYLYLFLKINIKIFRWQSKCSAIDLAQLEGWQSGNAADC